MSLDELRPTPHPVDPLFRERWSPRAFLPEAMPEDDLFTILDAARFAPSANNNQPWRFVYAHRDTPEWDVMTSILLGFNAGWAPNGSAMVLVYSLSKLIPPGSDKERTIGTHAFDAGAAWMSLALQASKLGYHTHAMGGVDKDKAAEIYGAPEHAHLHCAVVIGKLGEKASLSEEQQARETYSSRRPMAEIAAMGKLISE